MNDLPPDTSGFVYVPVPHERLPEVYELLASGTATPKDETVDTARMEMLKRVYRESDVEFRKLLRYLAKHPGQPMSTRTIAKDLELARGTGSLAGMLGAFKRRATNRYDGYSPIETSYNPVKDSTELSMPLEEAKIIEQIVADRRRAVKRLRKKT